MSSRARSEANVTIDRSNWQRVEPELAAFLTDLPGAPVAPASRHPRISDGTLVESSLALDRVLHHEELHCQQWATKGHARMIAAYLWEVMRDKAFGKTNRLEADAGRSDGGYR